MSEISVLSHEYKASAEFSQRFNWALIQVKKSSMDFIETEAPRYEEPVVYRKELALALEDILHLLDHQKEQRSDSAKWVPGTLIAQLLKERRGDLDQFLDDLEALAHTLRNPSAALSQEDFKLLDHIAGEADSQTSQVFRRMMRK